MEQFKNYDDMSVKEQLEWVTRLTEFANEKLPVLERLGGSWEQAHRRDFAEGLRLLGAFQFARDYVVRGLHYGDFSARVKRFRLYLEKVKQEIGAGLAMKGADGKTYALVKPSVPLRRRGRPTVEEVAARKRGEQWLPTDLERERQEKIAALLGLPVVISSEAPREKNNAELAEERARRQAEYDRQNPSLFAKEAVEAVEPVGPVAVAQQQTGQTAKPSEAAQPGAGIAEPSEPSPAALPTQANFGIDSERRLHLDELKPLMSPELRQKVDLVQGLRASAASKAEFAKALALQGAKPEQIEPYATEAQRLTDDYLAIYREIDEAMAIVHYRLDRDEAYLEKFMKRFGKQADIKAILKATRPYWEKMRSEELEVRIQTLIRQESPEYAARLAAEQAKKEEIAQILKYLRRTDKEATDVRLQSATEQKYPRLVELIGETEARAYLPYVEKIRELNAEWRKAHPEKAPSVSPASKSGKPSKAKEPTSKKKPVAKKSTKQPKKQ